jgi:tetratricopeptide (TPR) repeat protein
MPSDLESGDTLAAPGSKPGSAPGSAGSADPTLPAPGSSSGGSADETLPAGGGRAAGEVGLTTVDPELYAERVEITRGGMGRIIAARDRRLGRRVAIKELRDPGEGLRARFEREALLTARLQHPAIVSVHEAGRWPSGEPFIAMKLVPGVALDKVIARAKAFDDRLALLPHILAVADALAYAHQQRVVHRDLKPANVLIGDFGETVVIDWGLAKDLADLGGDGAESGAPYRTSGDGTETAVGSVLGTPAYMPVEQARGDSVDERADVYAIGAMLYHVLCGQPPYAGKTAPEVLAAVVSGPPPPLSSRQPGVPADLDALVTRALARGPAARYPTAKELADDLRRFQTGQLVGAHRYSRRQLLWRWVKRHRGAVAVATIALVTLATVATVSLRRIFAEQRRTDEARTLAEASRGQAEELMHFMLFELRKKLEPLGRLDILDPIATKAEDYYRRNPNSGEEAEVERRSAVAQMLGDVRMDQGKLAEALEQFRATLSMSEALAARYPETADYRFNVAVDHERVGQVLQRQGDLEAAMAELRVALVIVQELIAAHPPERAWQREQASIRYRMADIFRERGDLRGALAEQQSVLALRKQVAEHYRDDAAWFDLAVTHGAVGGTLEKLGDADGALREYRAELAIVERNAAIERSSAAWQSLLSASQDNVGDVLISQGDVAGAHAAFSAGLEIMKRLVAQDPDHVDRQHDLAVKHLKIAEVLEVRGELPAALAETRASLTIMQRLAERDATNAGAQRDHAVATTRVADLLLRSGDHDGASELYRQSMDIRIRLSEQAPDSAERLREVASGHDRLGKVLKAKGDLAGALVEYEAAIAIAKQLVARDPGNGGWQADLAIGYGKVGETKLKQKDGPGAVTAFRASLEIRERLLAADPDNKDRQRGVASTGGWLGDALVLAGDRAAAGAAYSRALALFEPLAAASSNPNWKGEAAQIRRDATRCCAAYIKEATAPVPRPGLAP